MIINKSTSRKTIKSEFYNKDPLLNADYKDMSMKSFLKRFKNPLSSNANLNIKMFKCYKTLGQGSFGRVILAYNQKMRKFFALKIMSKEKIVKKKQVEHTINEKDILYSSNHPNILKLFFVFKDNSYLYFGIQYAIGGDLYGHLRKNKKFDETVAKFYSCQIVSCFDYLHSVNVVYRDLKPENILINSRGYLKLIDFGFAKQVEKRTYTLCGKRDNILFVY
jgi:protein kinase A